jgi:hypothetical protein
VSAAEDQRQARNDQRWDWAALALAVSLVGFNAYIAGRNFERGESAWPSLALAVFWFGLVLLKAWSIQRNARREVKAHIRSLLDLEHGEAIR